MPRRGMMALTPAAIRILASGRSALNGWKPAVSCLKWHLAWTNSDLAWTGPWLLELYFIRLNALRLLTKDVLLTLAEVLLS